MDNELITEEFLRNNGWINKPQSSYSEDEIEEGYVDNCLYITSPYSKICHQWCYIHLIVKQQDGSWILNLGHMGLVNNLSIRIKTISEYNHVNDFVSKYCDDSLLISNN